MVLPDPPYPPYYKILDENIEFDTWWNQYLTYHQNYLSKTTDYSLLPYLLEAAPKRWYSRSVINLYTPVKRSSAKLFFRFSVDYESIIVGTAIGLFLLFRHIEDYHLSKSPQFRPGESFCCGRNNHFYLKWNGRSYVNPKKYFAYDRKLFYRKLFAGLPRALFFGCVGSMFCHVFSSQIFSCFGTHFPLFMAASFMTYEVYLKDKHFVDTDVHLDLYRYPELYGLAVLLIYNACRWFRNYSANIPVNRVLIG